MSDHKRESEARADVVVVGGGHAGVEAACAAARLGLDTLLLTLDPSAIGRMSCNPSIGGIAKGQIVREIDALGGVMGKLADRTAIHHRLLNRSKGPAVQSPRCQNDRSLYAVAAQEEVARAGVRVAEGEVVDLVIGDGRVQGVVLGSGGTVRTRAVVLTTGTFLGGVLHVGLERTEGGRVGERAAHRLAARLGELGLRTARLKTGTPPRLRAGSIDWSRTQPQPSDPDPVHFSFLPQPTLSRKIACSITRTTGRTHEIIRANLDRSPLFTGRITGVGPRYCPSIEDKIFRFPAQEGHQVFLEPEGLTTDLIYPNGISTSLPRDVQEAVVHSIPALEHAEIVEWGYAVEYVHVDPTECESTLETRKVRGLFLAGQINGTTGYEEAAGQGFVAGVNAAGSIRGLAPFVASRGEAYLGVLVDDLVTRGVEEPYRMFTSLAEHRLVLRHQNADVRLLHHAERIGILDAGQLARTRARRDRMARTRASLESTRVEGRSLFERLRNPEIGIDEVLQGVSPDQGSDLSREDREDLLIEGRYSGYLDRETEAIARLKASDALVIPDDVDYSGVRQLRFEARQKFDRIRPRTVGQAGRISGISPADVTILMIHLAKRGRSEEEAESVRATSPG